MNKYFNRPYLTTTYKPVLLKSFLHAGLRKNQGFEKQQQHLFKTEEGLYISLDYIAACFVSINWPIYSKYRLKQVTNKGVTLGIYNVFDQHNFNLRRRPKYNKEVFNDIIKILKKDVLYRLRKTCYIYEFVSEQGKIFKLPQKLKSTDFTPIKHNLKYLLLPIDVFNYLKNHYSLINTALNYQMAKFIETCNHAPKICTKVGENPNRKNLNSNQIRKLLELQDKSCFYCGSAISKDNSDADHFIPWSFVLETDVFNIVQTCQHCNRSKNDQLPDRDYFTRLQSRNTSDDFLDVFEIEEKKAEDKNRILEIYFNDCSLYFESGWGIS